jgi:hypothetical protein
LGEGREHGAILVEQGLQFIAYVLSVLDAILSLYLILKVSGELEDNVDQDVHGFCIA